MATFPTPPRWAETSAGVLAGNITAPPSGQLDTGFTVNQIPPSGYQNWFQNQVYQWIAFLKRVMPVSSLTVGQVCGPQTPRTTLAQVYSNGLGSSMASNGTSIVVSGFSGTNKANVYYSLDGGLTWTAAAHNLAGADAPSNIAWVPFFNSGAGAYVAVGGASGLHIATSPTGVTWTAQTGASATAQGQIAVSSISTGVVVIAPANAAGNIQWSTNGTAWNSVAVGTTTNEGVVWHNAAGLFILTGTGGTTANAIYTSPTGVTWTARTSPVANLLQPGYGYFQTAPFWTSAAAPTGTILNPDVAVIVDSSTGKIYTTTDGINYFQQGSGPINIITQWYWTGSVLVGYGPSGVTISADGVNFVNHPLPYSPAAGGASIPYNHVNGVCSFNGSVYVLGWDGTTTSLVWQSHSFPIDIAGQA